MDRPHGQLLEHRAGLARLNSGGAHVGGLRPLPLLDSSPHGAVAGRYWTRLPQVPEGAPATSFSANAQMTRTQDNYDRTLQPIRRSVHSRALAVATDPPRHDPPTGPWLRRAAGCGRQHSPAPGAVVSALASGGAGRPADGLGKRLPAILDGRALTGQAPLSVDVSADPGLAPGTQTTQLYGAGTGLARPTRPFPLTSAGIWQDAGSPPIRESLVAKPGTGHCSWAMTAAACAGRWW